MKYIPLLLLLLLGSCLPQQEEEKQGAKYAEEDIQESLPSFQGYNNIADERPLEQVPSELSIEHFANMKLVGTGLTLHAILSDNASYTRHQISYESNGLSISGILNIPKGNGPFPLVIFNHGFIDPAVYTVGRGLKREQDYLAKEGFAVLHTDYREHGESDKSPDTREIYDASLEYSMDSLNAIHAMRAANLPSIDTTKVGMLGHSLGGGVTLNIAVAHPEMIDAAVLYAPVHSDAWENFMRWRDMRDEGDRTRAALGSRESNPKNWDQLSSLTYLNRIDDPVLLFHGTNDSDVPLQWSAFLEKSLLEEKKDVAYIVYDNEKHEFIPKWNDFMERTVRFLKGNLTEELSIYNTSRITKKPFGIFITPENSPIEPEHFAGFHTGADFELMPGEDSSSIPITTLCDGTILFAGTINGYGGVVVQSCIVNKENVTVLYGHLSPSSFTVDIDAPILKGETIGLLGKGFSAETDNERPHLHLSVHRGSSIEYRGYVQSKNELSPWVDPIALIQ